MPNFEAKIRVEYGDIEGLLLDCRHTGLAADGSLWTNVAPAARPGDAGSHTGPDNNAVLIDSTKAWRTNEHVGKLVYNETDGSLGLITANTKNQVSGVLAGGAGNDWDTLDVYKIADPRFGNPYQDTVAERPTVATFGGFNQATFVKANQEHLVIPLVDDIPTGFWVAAFEYLAVGVGAPNDHPVLWFPNWSIWRQNAAGNYKYRHGAVDVAGAGDMVAGTWVNWFTGAATGALYRNGVTSLAGTHSAQAVDSGVAAGYIGANPAGVEYCDIILRTMQIWNRLVSPLEVDFAYQSLSPEFDYEQLGRADMLQRAWTDDTGTPGGDEFDRLNFLREAPQWFYVCEYPTGGAGRVQIVATVDGIVQPDLFLGGDLFDMVCIEHPLGGSPAVYQSAGWSSVFDIRISVEGHYTFAVYRTDGGTHVLHLDAEAV